MKIFCKHSYKVAKFGYFVLGEYKVFPCIDLSGKTLMKCEKCGKQILI